MELEQLVKSLEGIPPARSGMHKPSVLVDGRLYLSKSEAGFAALILEGAKESFGSLPLIGAIQFSDDVTALPSERRLKALQIVAGEGDVGNRIIAHLAYELHRRLAEVPRPDNESLIRGVDWLLNLLGERRSPMASEKQAGLVGEILFLRRLLLRARATNTPLSRSVACWTGGDVAKRDFYAPMVAVEVKTTAHGTRLHHISSLDQLEPQQHGEQVFLFSVGLRQDPSAPKKLPHFVADAEALMTRDQGVPDAQLIAEFREKLLSYGFDWRDRDMYERQESGFLAPHFPAELFAAAQLHALSKRDFVAEKVPETVSGITYQLSVGGPPLEASVGQTICDRLLRAP